MLLLTLKHFLRRDVVTTRCALWVLPALMALRDQLHDTMGLGVASTVHGFVVSDGLVFF